MLSMRQRTLSEKSARRGLNSWKNVKLLRSEAITEIKDFLIVEPEVKTEDLEPEDIDRLKSAVLEDIRKKRASKSGKSRIQTLLELAKTKNDFEELFPIIKQLKELRFIEDYKEYREQIEELEAKLKNMNPQEYYKRIKGSFDEQIKDNDLTYEELSEETKAAIEEAKNSGEPEKVRIAEELIDIDSSTKRLNQLLVRVGQVKTKPEKEELLKELLIFAEENLFNQRAYEKKKSEVDEIVNWLIRETQTQPSSSQDFPYLPIFLILIGFLVGLNKELWLNGKAEDCRSSDSTGTPTLGNYCGLIHHILKIQNDYEVIIMIADLHSLTVPKKEFDYQAKVFEMVALLYACGLNENCRVYIQSSVSEHLELMNLLSPHITVGKLGDMTQYKDKIKKEGGTGNLALLSYPVLMAADILLYNADLVIVGQDQKQHLELTEGLANKFNNFYGRELLKIPKFDIPSLGGKIMGLNDPTKKMSKSENDYIGLLDTPETVKEKLKKAKTDSNDKLYYDFKDENKEITEVVEEMKMDELDYKEFKEKVAEMINEKFAPIQEKYQKYLPKVKEMLFKNNKYLKSLAEKKLADIKEELKLV
nr:8350_t:CDS:2 [Entrophospora candida]